MIDDDDGPIAYYAEAFQDAGFEVLRAKTFKAALDLIQSKDAAVDFWVVDLMMPVEDDTLELNGENVAYTTSLGLGAGLLLYRELKKQHPSAPTMLLTSITTPKLLDDIEDALQGDDSCEAKIDTVPSRLVKLVRERLNA